MNKKLLAGISVAAVAGLIISLAVMDQNQQRVRHQRQEFWGTLPLLLHRKKIPAKRICVVQVTRKLYVPGTTSGIG